MYKWDVFNLNVLPNLRQLLVTFIGPELTNVPPGMWDEDLRCPHCVRLDKQFVCDFQPNTFYHDYVQGYTLRVISTVLNLSVMAKNGLSFHLNLFHNFSTQSSGIGCLLSVGDSEKKVRITCRRSF